MPLLFATRAPFELQVKPEYLPKQIPELIKLSTVAKNLATSKTRRSDLLVTAES